MPERNVINFFAYSIGLETFYEMCLNFLFAQNMSKFWASLRQFFSSLPSGQSDTSSQKLLFGMHFLLSPQCRGSFAVQYGHDISSSKSLQSKTPSHNRYENASSFFNVSGSQPWKENFMKLVPDTQEHRNFLYWIIREFANRSIKLTYVKVFANNLKDTGLWVFINLMPTWHEVMKYELVTQHLMADFIRHRSRMIYVCTILQLVVFIHLRTIRKITSPWSLGCHLFCEIEVFVLHFAKNIRLDLKWIL